MSRDLEQLLRVGITAARNGNIPAARALFRALTREHPGEPRAWLGLAGCAENRDEQRHALEQVLQLSPQHAQARAALARLGAPAAAPAAPPAITRPLPADQHDADLVASGAPAQPTAAQPSATDTQARPPIDAAGQPPALITPPTEAARRPPPPAPADSPPPAVALAPTHAEAAPEEAKAHFPLLNIIGIAVILLLLGAIGWLIGTTLQSTAQLEGRPSATPALLPAGATAPIGAGAESPPAPTGNAPAAPTAAAAVTRPAGSTAATPPAGSTARPAPSAEATLPLGTILSYDGWQAVLLQPDYSLFLEGSIGDLRPSGRFILALLAISNDAAAPRRIPSDLFILNDGSGHRYLPLPGASTAYLSVCGRGLCGDLALEDTLDAGSGMRTVPLIFDVPPEATNLTLSLGALGSAGWPITNTPPQEAPAGP